MFYEYFEVGILECLVITDYTYRDTVREERREQNTAFPFRNDTLLAFPHPRVAI
jgi:hypothetical protein